MSGATFCPSIQSRGQSGFYLSKYTLSTLNTHTHTHTFAWTLKTISIIKLRKKKSSGINHLVLQLNCIWNGTSRHTSHDRAGVLWTVRLSHVSGWPRHCVQVTASPGGLGSNLTSDRVLLSLTDRGILVWVQGARTCPGPPRSRQRGHSDTSPSMSHIHVFLVCGPLLLSELLYYHPVYLCPPERGGYTQDKTDAITAIKQGHRIYSSMEVGEQALQSVSAQSSIKKHPH